MQAQRNAFPLLRLQQLIRLGHKLVHALTNCFAAGEDRLPLGVKGALDLGELRRGAYGLHRVRRLSVDLLPLEGLQRLT